jgi:hypothetical protein
MPTTNLITRSLGSTDLSSGTGTPDHLANTGSLYTDTSTGITYINTTGTTTGWEQLQKPGYGELYFTSNATSTTIASTNSWVPITPNSVSWTFGLSNGDFIQSATSSLFIPEPRIGGNYIVMASCSLGSVSSTATYDVGISISGATPSSGLFHSTTVQNLTPADYATINIQSYVNLTVGSSIRLLIRCISSTAVNVQVRHASLIAIKLI